MRIAVNTLSVEPDRVGGGETYLRNLTAAFVPSLKEGESLLLLSTRSNERLFPAAGGRVRRLALPVPHRPRAARLLAEHLLLPVLLPAVGAHVLLSPGNAIPLLAGVRHVLALQSMHYRFVAKDMHPLRVRYFRWMVPVASSRAARVICMSRDLRRTLLEVVPRAAQKSVVIYEGADLSALSPGGARDGKEPCLLFLSSLNRFKRPDAVVRAISRLRRDGFEPPPVRFVGRPDPADRSRVEALALEEGVADLVRLEGVIPNEELGPVIRGARALLYPSVLETFGLPPLEAMACGVPVVASASSSVPEVVGDAALLVNPDDPAAFAAAIRRVLADGDERARLIRAGFENVRRFTWERTAEATLTELRAAAAGARLPMRGRKFGGFRRDR